VDESQAIVQRIFSRAAEKIGSTSALALRLRISYTELGTYLSGEAMPPEAVLLGAVELLIEEIPVLRREFSEAAWTSLPLPPA
jgi:hypothetical protein